MKGRSALPNRPARAATGAVVMLASLLAACSGGSAGGTVSSPPAGSGGGGATDNIDTTYLFSDQGSMFDSNSEPTATQAVTVTLRARHGMPKWHDRDRSADE